MSEAQFQTVTSDHPLLDAIAAFIESPAGQAMFMRW